MPPIRKSGKKTRQLYEVTLFSETLINFKSSFFFSVPLNAELLEFYFMLRSNRTDQNTDTIRMSFNRDVTDANYRFGEHRAGSLHQYSSAEGRRVGVMVSDGSGGSLGLTNSFSSIAGKVYNPSNPYAYKEVWCRGTFRRDTNLAAGDLEQWEWYHQWENTQPIRNVFLDLGGTSSSLYPKSKILVTALVVR